MPAGATATLTLGVGWEGGRAEEEGKSLAALGKVW